MKTLLDTLNSGTEWLEKKGIEDARRNMQMMLCHVLGFENPMQLYTDFDKPMQECELEPLREMLKQRGNRVPLQHLLGEVEFYKRTFKTDSRALIPRPETEELVSLILNDIKNQDDLSILDMGTGSGVLGLSLHLELTNSSLTLVDISEDALSLARENAKQLSANHVHFCQSHLFEKVEGKFDLIVANLPYIPESEATKLSAEVQHDPPLALYSGSDGLDLIRIFCSQAKAYLNPGGKIALEIGIHQNQQVERILAETGFSAINTKHDLNGVARFPFAEA